MGKRGQALVEFILILPILVLLLLIMVDLGKIFYYQYRLETHLDYLLKEETVVNEEYLKANNLILNTEAEQVIIKQEIVLLKPGLGNIIKSPYYIETKGFDYEK